MIDINQSFIQDIQNTAQTQLFSDNILESERNIRNKNYSALIDTYTEYIRKTVNFKNHARLIAFIIFMSIFIIIICFAIGVIQIIAHKENFTITDIATVFTSATALVSSLIVIPQKIIEFIFNKEEDKYIVDLIKNTQDFDNPYTHRSNN